MPPPKWLTSSSLKRTRALQFSKGTRASLQRLLLWNDLSPGVELMLIFVCDPGVGSYSGSCRGFGFVPIDRGKNHGPYQGFGRNRGEAYRRLSGRQQYVQDNNGVRMVTAFMGVKLMGGKDTNKLQGAFS
jgi:hypothetical protein